MLAAVGDLVEDVVVRLDSLVSQGPAGPAEGAAPGDPDAPAWLNLGTDTPVLVERRQGGSAANVCVAAAGLGCRARFIGHIGGDAAGRLLEEALGDRGVAVVGPRGGRTGTVVVLCHPDGERSMLTDRGSSGDLDHPDPTWLDDVGLLHLPLYSLSPGPLARTAATLAAWAREREIPVSLDLSSTELLHRMGPEGLRAALDQLRPSVVLANEAEGDVASRFVGLETLAPVTVVKRGPDPALVVVPGRPTREVAAPDLGRVPDTTGAGDAFAAGYLVATLAGGGPLEAAQAGHRCAAARLEAQRRRPDS